MGSEGLLLVYVTRPKRETSFVSNKENRRKVYKFLPAARSGGRSPKRKLSTKGVAEESVVLWTHERSIT